MGSANGRGEADFSARTRRLLAQRAAFRCSNPRCGALTIGPGATAEDVTDTGTAAHIFAAAERGPRGVGGLSDAERSDISNGIWLCAACGRLVDSNAGNGFSGSLLRSWKDLHEHRIRMEQGGQSQPFGWVQTLEVLSHYILMPGVVRFSKLNLLFGMNNSGKSKLLHILRALSYPHLLMDNPANLSCVITWFDPELRKALVEVRGRWLEYRVDDRRVALPPRPYRVLSLGPEAYNGRFFRWKASSVSGIAEFLGVDLWVARTVISNMPSMLPGVIDCVAFCGDDVRVSYRADAFDQEKIGSVAVWFYALAVFAELQARVEPTILVLDEPFVTLHYAAQRHVLDLFESATWTFQVIMAEHSLVAYERRRHGWSTTVLVPEGESRSRISQKNEDIERIGDG
ncbi:hypothetical protein ACTWJ8_32115 [Streptomyces sp. SDT5-1]|uniref:hypothetical protein n=1 Tax=Streptomyces sp. SDT5-1 TaxID=3406418 RepID=UPI003FCF59DB